MERRLGIRIVFDGEVDEFVFGGGVDSHGDGEAIFAKEAAFGVFWDSGGDDFVVWIVVGREAETTATVASLANLAHKCAHFKYEEHKRCALFKVQMRPLELLLRSNDPSKNRGARASEKGPAAPMTQIVVAMRSSWLFCFVLFC